MFCALCGEEEPIRCYCTKNDMEDALIGTRSELAKLREEHESLKEQYNKLMLENKGLKQLHEQTMIEFKQFVAAAVEQGAREMAAIAVQDIDILRDVDELMEMWKKTK